MLYETNLEKGVIPKNKINFDNLNVLALDLSEEDLFKFRFQREAPDPKFSYNYDTDRSSSSIKRIGFISRDFADNRPSGQLAGQFFPYLKEALDACDIEIYFYGLIGSVQGHFRNYATAIREVKNKIHLIDLIHQDTIDILIDMQGHMHNNFNDVLAAKPAPIIIHWLGYPGTLGFRFIDYIIADKVVIPPTSAKFYREKIVYFDHCYQVNNTKMLVNVDDVVVNRSTYNYPDGAFIFCHFNDNYKLDQHTFRIWMEILKRLKDSVLVLYATNSVSIRLTKDAYESGVDPKRLIYTSRLSRFKHVERLSLLNCGLDTYYCNGHTTSSDLIAAGIPVITFPNDTYHARVTKDLLLTLDLPELIANSWDQYIEIACKLAQDPCFFSQVKEKIISNRQKVLYNPRMYTDTFITALHNIWKNHYGVELPKHIRELHITPFGNNHTDYHHEWVYIKNKISIGGDIKQVPQRHQSLRDIAEMYPGCVAVTTDGWLKHTLSPEENWIDDDNMGMWIKKKS